MPMNEDSTNLARIRSHLANERTFLAWIRTALGAMAFGFLLEKIVHLFHVSAEKQQVLEKFGTLSLIFFILGGFLIAIAYWRYINTRKEIGTSGPLFSALPELLTTLAILALVIIVLFWFDTLVGLT